MAFALIAAPLIVAFPLWWEVLRNPSALRQSWDSWLLFVALPLLLGTILLVRSGRGGADKENGSA